MARNRRRRSRRKSKGKIDPLLIVALAIGGYFLYMNVGTAATGSAGVGLNDPSLGTTGDSSQW